MDRCSRKLNILSIQCCHTVENGQDLALYFDKRPTILHPTMSANHDAFIGAFYFRAARLVHDAEFVVQSFPNVEMFAVDRAIDVVNYVRGVLDDIEDNITPQDVQASMRACIDLLSERLESYRAAPPLPYNFGVQRVKPAGRGQPRLDLDLSDVPAMLAAKTKVTDIAEALGVSSRTVRNHMHREGLVCRRRSLTTISDVDLDEKVAEYVERHPLSGIRIVLSFLEDARIFVTLKRVNESMRRVDSLSLRLR